MLRTSEVHRVHENHLRGDVDLVRLQKFCDHLHRFRLHELVHFRSCLFRLLVLERVQNPFELALELFFKFLEDLQFEFYK